MNQKIKERWIKALRSGKFQQAKGMLRTPKGFCCLGVLCELHRRSQHEKWAQRYNGYEYLGDSTGLPSEVRVWAELDSRDPVIGRTRCASQLNDAGETFEYIANAIEKRL